MSGSNNQAGVVGNEIILLLGDMRGQLTAMQSASERQHSETRDAINRLEARVNGDIKAVAQRVDQQEERLRTVELNSAKNSAFIGAASGVVAGLAASWLKFKLGLG